MVGIRLFHIRGVPVPEYGPYLDVRQMNKRDELI